MLFEASFYRECLLSLKAIRRQRDNVLDGLDN